MGIYDRDYARADAPGARPRGVLGGLNVVQWIILINVAVFVLGMVMPRIQINLGRHLFENADPSAPMSIVTTAQQTPWGVPGNPIVQTQASTGRPEIVGFDLFETMPLLLGIGHFSTLKAFTHLEIWRFITYQFLHANLSHILFNMIGLWVFGPPVLRHLGSGRTFLAFYLVCGIFGAFLYLILNLLGWQFGALPGLLISQPWVPLVGASAAIFGVLMACAKVAGDDVLEVFYIIPMKTRVAAYLFFAIAAANLLFIRGHNIGGDAAHIGGALAGFFFIRRPHLLLDFFDDFLGAPRSAPKGVRASRSTQRVDRILEKVAREGMGSLSPREKRELGRASGRPRASD